MTVPSAFKSLAGVTSTIQRHYCPVLMSTWGLKVLGFGPLKWFLPEPTLTCLLASLSFSLPDLEVSIGRGVWKIKLKAKTGLFVFKRQHTLL